MLRVTIGHDAMVIQKKTSFRGIEPALLRQLKLLGADR